ncbi:MAG TPA: O-methyltransferase [Candidatus Eisenbacteria bacterium]|nr:O-methyltransferase [Candidatus Eisenbacteria bacterium]
MAQETWTAVDEYFNGLLVAQDAALEASVAASSEADLPAIQVSPPQGKLLHLIARMIGARNVLEIGTLGGYSTIWMARALPEDGRVLTLEVNPKHAQVALRNFANAGVAQKVDLRLGSALETLPKIAAESHGLYDLIFIDANKSNMPEYFEWSLKFSRRGGVIIADNVVRDGGVLDANSADADIQGVRRFTEMISREKRVSSTVIQTVGSKGYDGFAMLLVTD